MIDSVDILNNLAGFSLEEMEKLKLHAEIENLDAERKHTDLKAYQTLVENEEIAACSALQRVYTFHDQVRSLSVQRAIEDISQWTRRDSAGGKIKIVLNSPGGSVFEGMAFYDYLVNLGEEGFEIDVLALGMAASMGGILLQAGSTRSMGRNSWMLIHKVTSMASGSIDEVEDQIEFSKRLNHKCFSILASRSNLTHEEIEAKANKTDWWFDAHQALEYGFIDRIQ